MREILFRAKTICDGDWVYGGITWNPSRTEVFIHSDWDEGKVIPETVGQYTGLTDKNGTKIFEGDIVRYNNTMHEVVFCRIGGCAFFGITMPDRGEIWNFDGITRADRMEVIGNIHDNPELLNK